MRGTRILMVLVLGVLLVPGTIAAQEHPEHPADKKAEHPEHPEEAKITVDDLGDAIENWVAEQSKLMGGYFMVWDSVDNAALVLTLDKVHRERLSKLSDNVYFACADFKAKNGKVYDLDMFMSHHGDNLMATEVKVHKKDGAARYTWHEEGGVWKAKSK